MSAAMDESHETGRRPGRRPLLAGVEVRHEDLEQPAGLHAAATLVRVSSVVIAVLALAQFAAWWLNRPPGGAGLGLLVGDTIRLVVLAALLWAGSQLIELLVKSHYDIRAGRILLARQNHMLRQIGLASGMDVIGPNHTLLRELYTRFDAYLLDYDRARMDEFFAGPRSPTA